MCVEKFRFSRTKKKTRNQKKKQSRFFRENRKMEDEYERVLDLMTNKLTKDLYTRHIDMLDRLCRKSEERGGFLISKLDLVRQLLGECERNLQEGRSDFAESLNAILRVCSTPFVFEKASDHISNQENIQELLTSISTLVIVPATALSAIGTLHSFWNQRKNQDEEMEEGMLTFNQTQIHKSKVIENIAEAIRKEAEANKENASPLLRLLVRFVLDISILRDTALHTCRSGIIESMIQILDTNQDFLDEIVDALRLLTEMTERDEKEGAIARLSNEMSFAVLHKSFEHLIKDGYRRTDKELRNEILILLTTLASRNQNHSRFLTSSDNGDIGTLSLLLACMTTTTRGEFKNVRSTSQEDYEFITIAWQLISDLGVQSDACRKLVNRSRFLRILLAYVDVSDSSLVSTSSRRDLMSVVPVVFARARMRELKIQALQILHESLTWSLREVMSYDAARICVKFVNTFLVVHEEEDEEEAKESTSARHDSVSTGLQFLVALSRDPSTHDSLVQSECMGLAMEICCREKGETVVSMEWATMLMSQLCTQNADAKSEFKSLGGVQRFLDFLKNSLEGMVLPEVLIGSVVNLLSSAIVGHRELENQFFDQEGSKILLNLLDSCPRFMRNVVLGFLADLAKSTEDASFFYNLWRSPRTGHTLRHRLVEFWLQEETRLGVTRETQGQLRNLKFPATESESGTKSVHSLVLFVFEPNKKNKISPECRYLCISKISHEQTLASGTSSQ